MERGKWKNTFVKHNITRYVDSALFWIKALKTLMQVTIPEKHTLFGSKLKFLSIIGSQFWPNRTSKGAKKAVVGFAA